MYLLEGQMGYGADGKSQRTVGPKCAEVMNPTTKEACNLQKFLEYIWAPRVFEETKPDGTTRTIYKNAKGEEYKDAENKPLTLQQIKDTKRPQAGTMDLKAGTSWTGVKMQSAFDLIKTSVYVDGTDADRLLPVPVAIIGRRVQPSLKLSRSTRHSIHRKKRRIRTT